MDFLQTPKVLKRKVMEEAKNVQRGTSDQEEKLKIQCGINKGTRESCGDFIVLI